MKAVFGLIAIFALIAVLNAKDECDVRGHKFAVGEEYNPIGECFTYTCRENGDVSALTCPSVHAPANCKFFEEDITKPYPACCSKFVCD